MERTVREYSREDEFTRAAAQFVAREAARAVRDRERFLLALAGGSTPRDLYTTLARPPLVYAVDWPKVLVFFGDERLVPPAHAWSNYAMAAQSLLHKVPLADSHVFRMSGESDTPRKAAREYAATLDRVLGPEGLLDLVILGMGPDGHTASLFPHSQALEEESRLALAVHPPDLDPKVGRLTLTLPALNRSRKVLFLVREEGKEAALTRALTGDPELPAGRVRPREELYWFILSK